MNQSEGSWVPSWLILGLLGLARLRALGRHLAAKDVATQLQHAPRQAPRTSFSGFLGDFGRHLGSKMLSKRLPGAP